MKAALRIVALLMVTFAMMTTYVDGAKKGVPIDQLCNEDPTCDSGYRDKKNGNCCAFITDDEYKDKIDPQASVGWDTCTGGVVCLIRWPPWKSNCFTGWVDILGGCCYL